MEYKGIDVSKWQGVIDWAKVKSSGIQFAIIRSSCGTTYLDPQLQANVKGCEANGIPYGFYHYTYAKTVAEAEKEAEYFLKAIAGYSPSYPVYFDIEDNNLQGLGKTLLTDMTVAFCGKLEKAGYYSAVYANKYWLSSILDYSRLARFDCWLAQYSTQATWDGNYGIWQFSSRGKVNGIIGNVDMDTAYKDYAAIISKLKLNKLKATSVSATPSASTTTYCVSFSEISTKGEAETIKNKIEAMGYIGKIEEKKI